MPMLPLLLLPLLLPASQGQDREALMRRIESKVRLPDDARPLESYDRYYRWSGPDEVVAGFVIPYPPSDPDQGCTIFDSKGERPCPPPTAGDREKYRKALAQFNGPRERLWVDGRYLPSDGISDGGCTVVHIRYDVAADRVTHLSCNGRA
ncbi:MAG TPA: hypothetical protein VN029_04860 [Sphingomonas sp.]|nr:hypothetical protein [Sphingomonas sp.]